MSDILIRGMEMPKNEPLLVKINPDGSVSTTAKNGYKKYEAIPVQPHGRLGDLDELEAEMRRKTNERFCVNMVCDAPTIIPASEEGE